MPEIISGISQSYSHDERIIVFKVSSLGINSLKSWSNAVVTSLEHWPDENYLAIYDLSDKGIAVPFLALTSYHIYNVGITTAGQQRVDTVLEARPNLKVKLAFVLSAGLSGDTALRRGRQAGNTDLRVEYKVYFDQAGAVNWLEQFVTAIHPSND